MHTEAVTYPVRFSVDCPARPLSRLSTLFRLVVAIPIVIVLGSVGGAMWEGTERPGSAAAGAAGLLFFGPLLMILFRRKYPRWWFDWNRELLRFLDANPRSRLAPLHRDGRRDADPHGGHNEHYDAWTSSVEHVAATPGFPTAPGRER